MTNIQYPISDPPLRNPKSEIRNKVFLWGSRTYILGILNATPDSFSGDGMLSEAQFVEVALAQAQKMLDEGADMLDLGGESTRPGSAAISAEEELRRVLPILRELRQITEIPISIDTSKAKVAAAALEAGADLVNDVWGLRLDPDMAGVVAAADVPVVLMHNRSTPKATTIDPELGGRYVGVAYDDLIEDVKRELGICLDIAHRAGIPDERIILDPGIGFGKTVAQNLELLDRLDEIKSLGYPLLLGTSRKSFIGYTLDLPFNQRAEGTAATTAIGIARGADIVRVHDVLINARVARMTDAIVRGQV
jgi:dihydropteroate synthase